MWGSNKSKGWAGSTTLISAGTQITGDICFRGHLEIEGKVVGNICAEAGQKAVVRVMNEGSVEGEIRVPAIVLNGKVVGNVYGSEHVELAENAVIDGDVHYNLVEIMKGAAVNGNLVHESALKKQDVKSSGDFTAGLESTASAST